MDWLVFGDDWGAHPSTTQHLVRNLPYEDRVVYVNSIGMRSPGLGDLGRAGAKLGGAMGLRSGQALPFDPTRLQVVEPRVLPWHRSRAAQAINRRSLAASIRPALDALGIREAVALLSNPVASLYLAGLPIRKVGYLRLDDYARLPGVDSSLVTPLDAAMCRDADVVIATAESLLPAGRGEAGQYLPQGVDFDHFAAVPMVLPDASDRVLGFFGLIAEWLDFALIDAVSQACPDWTLELIGPIRHLPPGIRRLANVFIRPPVAYEDLPAELRRWRAAWVPFQVSELTQGVNPLKVREYLAAGLPSASTPIPEVRGLAPWVAVCRDAAEIAAWLSGEVASDSPARRAERRESVRSHSWAARAARLRSFFGGSAT